MFEPYIPKDPLFRLYTELDKTQLPMFMAVVLGIKPLMDTWLPLPGYLALQKACEEQGVIVGNNNIMTHIPNEEFLKRHERLRNLGTTKMIAMPFSEERQDALVHTFISRSAGSIDEARRLTWYNLFVGEHQLLQPLIDNFRYGDTLGYPECCTRFYAGHNGKFHDGKRAWGWNTPLEVYKNTKGKFSFYCNHIPMDHQYFLIHHYPCSYNCEKTISQANQLLKAIRKTEPGFAEKIERYLKLPYLIFEEKKAFVFEGESSGNEIIYTDCKFLGDNRDKGAYHAILNGNRIVISDEKICIYKDKKLISEYKKEGKYKGWMPKFE